MPDDLLTVMLCELGEHILAMRELLAAPAVMSKPHTLALSDLLAADLDSVGDRLQRDVITARRERSSRGDDALSDALYALADCAAALRSLHRRLGLLDMRWNVAPCDIFLRKLRDDVGDLPHPAIVLSDDADALDHDVAERLRSELAEVGIAADRSGSSAEPVIALPRLEATNPLAWPLLLPRLVHLTAQRDSAMVPVDEHAAVARLGGPAAFAACAAHALIAAAPDRPVWPALAGLAAAAPAWAGGLEEAPASEGAARRTAVSFFTDLLRARDHALGHAVVAGQSETGNQPGGYAYVGAQDDASRRARAEARDDASRLEPARAQEHPAAYGRRAAQPGAAQSGGRGTALPASLPPTGAEVAALLDKLADGTPINAIDPPLPRDFVARLDAVRDAAGLYDLIAPVGERPAPLAGILGVGWLYKIRHSYPLFDALLQRHGTLGTALDAYRPHQIERNELLLQSIEAAHVQGVFIQGRDDT